MKPLEMKRNDHTYHSFDFPDEFYRKIAFAVAEVWSVDIHPEKIGQGYFGQAFKTTDDKYVIKVTLDELESQIAERTKKHNLPGIIKYHDVRKVKSRNDEDINKARPYVLLMDKVTPLEKFPQREMIVAFLLGDDFYGKAGLPNSFFGGDGDALREKAVSSYSKKHRSLDMDVYIDMFIQLNTIYKSLHSIGVVAGDVNTPNLGLDENWKLTLFDIGATGEGGQKIKKKPLVMERINNIVTFNEYILPMVLDI